ncbi:hypothetical protein [Stappia sp. BW2]|uniref:hypothetical protein n=1 Tax=Stappia sp. BW2 TaxID=2592622 RepID=UPI0012945021|nr:hypothetical protein [Stappia sp. BW2]
MTRSSRKKDAFPLLLLVSASLLMLAIVAYPLFETFRLSVTNTNLSPDLPSLVAPDKHI